MILSMLIKFGVSVYVYVDEDAYNNDEMEPLCNDNDLKLMAYLN